MRASRRISHTAANPGMKFFGCPRYVSKVGKNPLICIDCIGINCSNG
ncbi:hypothetical protein LINPERHAP2_LOCUS15685 [Linum perenne]